ncbi:MAG TPA: hypothetical protein VKM35_08855 [Arenimonas sp.]|uniref:hypothetical protein n=1 Tax=Arenimonas sp. TaxID=1872635 RepID=UPI002C1316FA|nr:hypothetical protein [Arenimonas sp.]HMB57306.1 hypothetical protein [Arenimonas sp.]
MLPLRSRDDERRSSAGKDSFGVNAVRLVDMPDPRRSCPLEIRRYPARMLCLRYPLGTAAEYPVPRVQEIIVKNGKTRSPNRAPLKRKQAGKFPACAI